MNYGWRAWFATVLFGAVVGGAFAFIGGEGNVGSGAELGAAIFGVLGIFPSIFIAIKYKSKTEAPAYLGKGGGRPRFLNKEYQRLFDELNKREN